MIKHKQWGCVECKSKTRLTIDHIIPLSNGGANKIENLQWLCQECHWNKNVNRRIELKYVEIEKLKKLLNVKKGVN